MTLETSPPRRANRWMLYGPLAAGAVLFAIYSVVWMKGADIMRGELEKWVAGEEAAGAVITYDKLKVEGYPFVLRGRINAPDIRYPLNGWAWRGERLYVDTLPYNPTRLIISTYGSQEVRLANGAGENVFDLEAEAIRVSLAEEAIAASLDDVVLSAREDSAAFSRIELGTLRMNADLVERPETGSADRGQLDFGSRNLRLTRGSDGEEFVIPLINAMILVDGMGALMDAAPGMTTAQAWKAADGQVMIEDVEVIISRAEVTAPSRIGVTGTVELDMFNFPAGAVSVSFREPAALLNTLSDLDLIDGALRQQIDAALTMLGDNSLPLTLKGGQLLMVGVPLGDLPKVE